MTLMAFLLLIILFLVAFLYFSTLNPQDLTLYYLPDQSVTFSVAVIVVGGVIVGLILGYLLHLYSTVGYHFRHWKKERADKKAREADSLCREGFLRLLCGDFSRAGEPLRRAADWAPARLDIALALAKARIGAGDLQEGAALLLKARSLDPRNPQVLFLLAETCEAAGNDGEAARAYDEILLLERDNLRALRGRRDLHLRRGRWREALELQRRIAKSAGSDRPEEERKILPFRYEAARLALQEGRTDEGTSELRELTLEAPDFVPARVSLGDACRLRGDTEEAARIWRQGYLDLRRDIFLARLEELHLAGDDLASLLDFCRATLREGGEDPLLRFFAARLCLRLEKLDEAAEHLWALEAAGAGFPLARLLLAEVHRRRNRPDEAVQAYGEALGVDPLYSGYACDSCAETSPDWQGRCPRCGAWGTLSLTGQGRFRALRSL